MRLLALVILATAPTVSSAAELCRNSAYPERAFEGHVQPVGEPDINFEFISDIENYPSGKIEWYACVANLNDHAPLLVIWKSAQIFHVVGNLLAPKTPSPILQEVAHYQPDPDQKTTIEYTVARISQPATLYLKDAPPAAADQAEKASFESTIRTRIIDKQSQPQDISITIKSTSTQNGILTTIQHLPRVMRVVVGTLAKRLSGSQIEMLYGQMKEQGRQMDIFDLDKIIADQQRLYIPSELLDENLVAIKGIEGNNEPAEIKFSLPAAKSQPETVFIAGMDGDGYLLATGSATILLPVE